MPGGSLPARWQPLRKLSDAERKGTTLRTQLGLDEPEEVWQNDRYEVWVHTITPTEAGIEGQDICYLSIKTLDRSPMRNWRHFQQIKNEVVGPERWAMEVFPAESQLVDTSNQYHLFVMPEGVDLPWAFREGPVVSSDEQVEAFNAAPHKGRQEPWEPGLTTGRQGHEGHPILDGGDPATLTADAVRAVREGTHPKPEDLGYDRDEIDNAR